MSAPSLQFSVEDPGDPQVVLLLQRHLAFARATSPARHVHALDLDGLRHPAVTFVCAREHGQLLGVGALREIEPGHGEIKSMHTAAEVRGKGVGAAMVQHLLGLARARKLTRVSLETGAQEAFAPARRLYERAGFRRCPPFAGYWENEFSVCMTLALDTPA